MGNINLEDAKEVLGVSVDDCECTSDGNCNNCENCDCFEDVEIIDDLTEDQVLELFLDETAEELLVWRNTMIEEEENGGEVGSEEKQAYRQSVLLYTKIAKLRQLEIDLQTIG